MTNAAEFIPLLIQLAQRSGEIITPYYFNLTLEVESKGDGSPVTRADREAELVMRELIHSAYPSHGIMGEEFGTENSEAEFVWSLDPIDGTVSFAQGCPLFGTLIALLHEGQPILGAIHQPILKQLCIGDGDKTTLNGNLVKMREVSGYADAILLATDLAKIELHQNFTRFDKLRRETKLFRTWGDCYGYLLLAAGFADIMLDPIMNPWDILPLVPIIHGAGGVITTWNGGDAVTGNSCVAASKKMHALVINSLNND